MVYQGWEVELKSNCFASHLQTTSITYIHTYYAEKWFLDRIRNVKKAGHCQFRPEADIDWPDLAAKRVMGPKQAMPLTQSEQPKWDGAFVPFALDDAHELVGDRDPTVWVPGNEWMDKGKGGVGVGVGVSK